MIECYYEMLFLSYKLDVCLICRHISEILSCVSEILRSTAIYRNKGKVWLYTGY